MKTSERHGKTSLKLQAYHYLKGKILSCEYAPGQMLNEQRLCAEMGNISRTPMRDALGRLEQEGLVVILPKKGLMVCPITAEDVCSIFEVRRIIEPYALRAYGHLLPRPRLQKLRQAVQGMAALADDEFCAADDEFHSFLVSVLPNRYLMEAYRAITAQNTRFRIMSGQLGMLRGAETQQEHLAVLDAALAGDWAGAAAAMEHHLEVGAQTAQAVLQQMQHRHLI